MKPAKGGTKKGKVLRVMDLENESMIREKA